MKTNLIIQKLFVPVSVLSIVAAVALMASVIVIPPDTLAQSAPGTSAASTVDPQEAADLAADLKMLTGAELPIQTARQAAQHANNAAAVAQLSAQLAPWESLRIEMQAQLIKASP